MVDSLDDILYGKTDKVVLADGKEYTVRELDLQTLNENEIQMDQLATTKNLQKIVFLMLKTDNPEMTEKRTGRLVTISVLQNITKVVFKLMGVEEGKNVEARK